MIVESMVSSVSLMDLMLVYILKSKMYTENTFAFQFIDIIID
jgi:hypothetical protein